jgi:uncharacterized membrane protein YtjA (UPF0391 family)|tara:strand:- start:329 stop:535 length:207 start_codon:yes stop_codon:yes gene_type:complete
MKKIFPIIFFVGLVILLVPIYNLVNVMITRILPCPYCIEVNNTIVFLIGLVLMIIGFIGSKKSKQTNV